MADFTIEPVDGNNNTLGVTGNPWVTTNNDDANCAAALLTAVTSAIIAGLWEDERKDAINDQNATETEILECFDSDLQQYCDIDHPQQLLAINTALEIPECEVTCSPCITEMDFRISCVTDECTLQYALANKNAGLARARHLDRQLAKQRFATCSANRRNHIIRAGNLSHVDYSRAYQYFANASTIHGSLAGAAAQAYGNAVTEFSYGFGILGRGSNVAGSP